MEKVRAALLRLTKTALGDSIPADLTGRIAKDVMGAYDLHGRTGFRDSIPISGQIAASAVVDDAAERGRFLLLVERMAQIDRDGFMGRPYKIPILRDLFKAIQAEGYVWDEGTRHFMENPSMRRTPNWGRLIENEEYRFSLLRLDIVKNSRLVKQHGEEAARLMYGELRDRFARCVEHRHGRVWKWEGDGGMAAFHYGHGPTSAALAGIAFIHELYFFNRTANTLGEPISVRIAAHSGPLLYSASAAEVSKQETAKELVEIESRKTPPDALCLSTVLSQTLDRVILDRFEEDFVEVAPVHIYRVETAS